MYVYIHTNTHTHTLSLSLSLSHTHNIHRKLSRIQPCACVCVYTHTHTHTQYTQEAQQNTALWLIDNLAIRAGNEKDTSEEADTVGCCSLRVEHITLGQDQDGETIHFRY